MSQIVSIRRVKGNGFQAELTDKVQVSTRINVLGALNKGDERFRQGSLRHAWFPVTLESLEELGVDKETLAKINALTMDDAALPILIESPKVAGEELCIQVNESVYPDPYQRENASRAAKQLQITMEVAANKGMKTKSNLANHIGETGYFLSPEGHMIFSRTVVTVKSQLKHNIIADATFVPAKEMAEYGASLAEPQTVNADETADKDANQ